MRRPRPPSRSSAARPIALVVAALAIAVLGRAWTGRDRDPPGPDWQAVELQVEGLDCAFWCSVRVLDVFENLPGTAVDALEPATGTLRLRFDPSRRSPGEIADILALRGFPVLGQSPLEPVSSNR
jgi:hypothetical protein